MNLNFKKSLFAELLPADIIENPSSRQVFEACYSYVLPKKPTNPKLLAYSDNMSSLLEINEETIQSQDFLNIITGNNILPQTRPYAMCYGGHQFGNWAGQLGDGRAINLFDIEANDERWTLQLKGAGPTPYSRNADGFAVLRSSIREFLCSEAMFYLNIPTSRALTLCETGDDVMRDMLYNGNPRLEKGAIVCRVTKSFVRFGNYEIFASRGDIQRLQQLTDFVISQYYPHLGTPSKSVYLQFFKEVAERTMKMIIHWQRVGFVHGVMNTDNMSILGDTIDYGPFGFLDFYNPNYTPNTTDFQGRRYRFDNQLNIGMWNLVQLANALYPLIEEEEPIYLILNKIKENSEQDLFQMYADKLGLHLNAKSIDLTQEMLQNMEEEEIDYTLFFRQLSIIEKNTLPENAFDVIAITFYKNEVPDAIKNKWIQWLEQYIQEVKLLDEREEDRMLKMNSINPKYILRNYMLQLTIEAAEKGDYSLLQEMQILLKNPYEEMPQFEKWYDKMPDWARNKVGSSVLSCSS
jgi:serine/tyrosine/threonine adenylyltransferase